MGVSENVQWWFNQFHDWYTRVFDDMHLIWFRGENWCTVPLGNLFFNCCDWIVDFIEVVA